MNVLIITHTGETLGHLIRGLAIADELKIHGAKVEFAVSMNKARWLLNSRKPTYEYHDLNWQFSHNSCDKYKPPFSFLERVIETNFGIKEIIQKVSPDIILSMPGIVTTQIAKSFGIPHIAIMHGPYLSPIVNLNNPTSVESSILDFTKQVFYGGCVDKIFLYLSNKLNLPKLTYEEFLHTENIIVPQPGLPLPNLPNIHQVNFISASIGKEYIFNDINLKDACYITFGSGNPVDFSRIVQLTCEVFPSVIINTGFIEIKNISEQVISKPFISNSSLAGQIALVISHGGIGTVGTFAEYKTSQIIIPTEVDQATMAIHAYRLGIANHCGLESKVKNLRLGRSLPSFTDEEFMNLLKNYKDQSMNIKKIESTGAKDIASLIINKIIKF